MFKKSKIIYIEQSKNLPESFSTLKNLAKKQGMELENTSEVPELSFFEQDSVVLLVSGEFFNSQREKLLEIRDLSFLVLMDNKDIIEKMDLESFDSIFNTDNQLEEYIPNLRTLSKMSKKLTNEKIGRLYEMTSAKLERVKKIHEKVVPVRIEKSKNLTVYSKYGAGTSRGGDFYDIANNENFITFLMSTTKSYITSTVVTSHFEKVRNSIPSRELYEDMLEDLINECRDLELINREEPDLLELVLVTIDLKKLSFFGYQFGRFQCISSNQANLFDVNQAPLNENYIEECYIDGKFLPGEKFCILSPGILKNLGKGFENIGEMDKLSSKDFLNNIFFNLKKENGFEDFLTFDSTAAIVEVNSNVLVQI